MVIVMRAGAEEAQIHAVIDRLNAFGFDVHRSSGLHRTVLGAIGSKPDFDIRHIATLDGVEAVHRITVPYENLLRSSRDADTDWEVGGHRYSRGRIAVFATLPSEDLQSGVVRAVVEAGVDGLSVPVGDPDAVRRVLDVAGSIPVLAEVGHTEDAEPPLAGVAGYRMTGVALHERPLLRRLSELRVPVVVDRPPGASVEEWLRAAERLIEAGCPSVAVCEAGSRSPDPGRSLVPDIGALALVRERTRLAVLADPGRAVADADVAQAAACAAAAAGAHGVFLSPRSGNGAVDVERLRTETARIRSVAAAVR